MPLEIACFTPASAISASKAGADRIELCANYAAGGVTPDIHSLLAIRREVGRDVPINVMIRPRAGDFVYSTKEMEVMRHDIALFTPLASGFVFGILDVNGRVDVARNSELVDIAAPLPCTFHRAVDEVGDLEGAVEMVVGCGFRSVLTSGGCSRAGNGVGRLKGLQERFAKRVDLIVGGGIRSGNVVEVKRGTGAIWVHSAAITGTGEEVDAEEIRRIKDAIDKEANGCDGDQEMAD